MWERNLYFVCNSVPVNCSVSQIWSLATLQRCKPINVKFTPLHYFGSGCSGLNNDDWNLGHEFMGPLENNDWIHWWHILGPLELSRTRSSDMSSLCLERLMELLALFSYLRCLSPYFLFLTANADRRAVSFTLAE